MMDPDKVYSIFLKWAFWLVLWTGTLLIIWSSRDYLPGPFTHDFLLERPYLLHQNWWRISVKVHAISGCLCLASSLLQYSGLLLKKYPKIHKSLGYVYIASLLFVVVPSGLILCTVAKGGLISQIGFFVMNLLTLLTVFLGLNSILNGKIKEHQIWITRSFGLVSSAITFRTLLIVLLVSQVPLEVAYPACVWLSMIINALLVEFYLYQASSQPKQKSTTTDRVA